MNSALFEEFCEFAQTFRGKPCWNVSAGVVGSIFYLDLGEQFRRKAGNDAKLTDKRNEPHFTGEFVIHSLCAVWRIDDSNNNQVLATSDDNNDEDGPMLNALRKLKGATVTSLVIRRPGLDCSIRFDNGLVLEIFPVDVEHENYSLWCRDTVFSVGPRSRLDIGKTSE